MVTQYLPHASKQLLEGSAGASNIVMMTKGNKDQQPMLMDNMTPMSASKH
jgi:hypothetical protein